MTNEYGTLVYYLLNIFQSKLFYKVKSCLHAQIYKKYVTLNEHFLNSLRCWKKLTLRNLTISFLFLQEKKNKYLIMYREIVHAISCMYELICKMIQVCLKFCNFKASVSSLNAIVKGIEEAVEDAAEDAIWFTYC